MSQKLEGNPQKMIRISEAAKLLGVSVDTLRRWEEQGVITAHRRDKGHRYFALEDVQRLKENQPLTIAEAAKELHMSVSTLRRLEDRGDLIPEKDSHGRRSYPQQLIDDYLKKGFVKSKSALRLRTSEKPTAPTLPALPFITEAAPINPTPTPRKVHAVPTAIKARPTPILPSLALGFALTLLLPALIVPLLSRLRGNDGPPPIAQIDTTTPASGGVVFETGEEAVRGLTDSDLAKLLQVNIPSEFNEDISAPGITLDLADGIIIASNIVNSVQGQEGDITLNAGPGLTISGLTFTNTDPGSAQAIFKNLKVGNTNISADQNADTVNIAAGEGVTIAANANTDTITISAAGTAYEAGNDLDLDGSTFKLESTLDSVTTLNGLTAIDSTTASTIRNAVTLSGDISGALSATTITDGVITEADLKAVDTAADEECLTYETTVGDFEWEPCGSGSGITSFDVAGESGTTQTITDGNTLTITAGTGIDSVASATDTITISVQADSIDGASLSDTITLDSASLVFSDGTNTLATLTDAGTTGNLSITGDLTISGGNITSAVTFDAGLSIAASQTITIGGDAIDEFVGTGLALSSGDLTTTLGTAIDTSEITNDTIDADDLDVATAEAGANDEECLTFETSGGGDFEWQACGGGAGNSFETIVATAGTNPVADSSTDTLTLTASTGDLVITGTAGSDTLDFTVAADALDFTELADALGLDAATSITGTAGEVLSLARTLTDATAENAMTITVTASDAGSATTSQYGLAISNAASTEGADALLFLDNADADDSVADGIRITSAAGTILTGLDFDDTDIVTDIELQNAETIDNNTDGTVLITAPTTQTSGNLTVAGTGGLTFSGAGGDITFTNGEKIDNDVDGTLAITAPTTTLSGDLTITGGNITSATTFDAGLSIAASQTITIGGDAIDEFVGTGLQLSSGDLQTTLGTSIAASEVDADSLDFTEFQDTLDLDASTTITFDAAEQLIFDASTTASTTTAGVLDFNINAGNAAVDGLNLAFTSNDGATAATDHTAFEVLLTANDADADVFGLVINAAATTNAAAGSYEALIKLDNLENTAGAVPDAILITDSGGVSGGITDAIDVSSSNITNAINVGDNTITGTTAVIDLEDFDVSADGKITLAGETDANDLRITSPNADIDSVNLIGNSLVGGSVLSVSSSSTALDFGRLAEFSHSASTSGLAGKLGSIIYAESVRTDTRTTGTTADDYDLVNLLRHNRQNGAGGTFTATGSVLRVENTATQLAGTLTDTVIALELVQDADSTGDAVFIDANQSATGDALQIDFEGTGLALNVDSAGNADTVDVIAEHGTYTNDILNIQTNTSQGTGFNFIKFTSDADGTPDVEFTINGQGDIATDGDLTLSGGNITNAVTFDSGLSIAASQTITIGGDAIDEFVGTGLALSSGDLTTTLGTAIDTSEITDGTIDADDLDQATADGAPGDEECLTFETSGGGDFEWQACGASTTLQTAYDAGATIEILPATSSVVITETTATAAQSTDLLQLTINPATGGSTSGDALQITLDAVDATSSTGAGLHIVIDQSQATGDLILAEDDAGTDLFRIEDDGATTISAAGAVTTALTITDTDFTNALSIGDNGITGTTYTLTGTTAVIDFTDFDVDADGNVALAPDAASDILTITAPAGASQGLVINATAGNTSTTGVIEMDVWAGNAAVDVQNLDLVVNDGATAGTDFKLFDTNLTANDADADLFGLVITTQPSTNAAAGSFEALIRLDNNENTAGAVTDGILIIDNGGVADGITDAIDASSSNITNALNVGDNTITGTAYQIEATSSTLTLDAATDINLDAAGADIFFKGAGTTFATWTKFGTDLVLDIAGGQLYVSDTDTINIGGSVGLTYNSIADSGGTAATSASGDNDLFVEDILETAGTLYVYGGSNTVLGAAEKVFIDAATTDNTGTAGILDLDIDAGNAAVDGLNIDFESADGATAATDHTAFEVLLTANDADADVFGLVINAAATTNAAAGSYEALIKLDNLENTAGAVPDAILITDSGGVSGGITDAIDVSSANITNAINVGANTILGTTAVINFDDFDVSQDGAVTLAPDGTGDVLGLFVPSGTSSDAIYVSAPANIYTGGIFDLDLQAGNAAVDGINMSFTSNNGATAGTDQEALVLDLTANDADADVFGLVINAAATANAAAGSYEAAIKIDNAENTAGSMPDAIIITATTDTATTDAIDVSDAEIVNALNVGANTITGTSYSIDASGTLTLGSSGLDALVVTVDGTGTGEVQLPADAIDETEIDVIDGDTAGDEECLTYESGGANGTFEWQSCGGGGTTLQTAYDAGATIEILPATGSVVITETTATAAQSTDLLQLTINPATGGSTSGDALQITLDAVDATSSTGAGLHIVIDQSQATGDLILAEDDAGTDLFRIEDDGATTISAAGAVTTALTITDTDFTNALSIGDNNITGTTAAIDFTDFDVSADGKVTLAGDADAVDFTITSPNSTADIFDVSASSLTTGTAIDISNLSALTEGKGLNLASTSTSLTTGYLLYSNLNASGSLSDYSTGPHLFASQRTETGGATSDDYDTIYLLRNQIANGLSANLTSTGSVLHIENLATQISGTLTDTTIGLELVMGATGTGDGINIDYNPTATGNALQIDSETTAGTIVVTSQTDGTNSASNAGLAITAESGAGAAYFYRNLGAAEDDALVEIFQDHASGDQAALYIDNDATGAQAIYVAADNDTAPAVYLEARALTTGSLLTLESGTDGALNNVITSGQLFQATLRSDGTTLANKSGSAASISAYREEDRTTGTTADDYDLLGLSRTSVTTGAGGTMTSTGSVLRLENIATQTAGTLTDTTIGLELVMGATGTGDGINIDYNPTATGNALQIDSETVAGTIVVTSQTDGTNSASNAGLAITAESGAGAAYFYRNQAAAATDDSLVEIVEDSTSDQAALHIQQDGNATGAEGIRIVQGVGDSAIYVDAITTDHTSTAGVLDLDIDAGNAAVDGLNIDFESVNGVTAGTDQEALVITLTANDADADVFGLVIRSADTTNGTTGSYEALLRLENANDNASGVVTDAILITMPGITSEGLITDGLDASDQNITNALNVGYNTITGAEYTIESTSNHLNLDPANGLIIKGDYINIYSNDGLTLIGTIDGNAFNESDLELNSAGGNVIISGGDTLTIGGADNAGNQTYNIIADAGGATTHSLSSDDDLLVEGDFETDEDVFHDLPASGQVVIDAATVDTTTTAGVLDMNIDAGNAAVTGINLDFEMINGVTAGTDQTAIDVLLTASDADGDMIGLNIVGAATAVAAAGSYENLIRLENLENTAGAVANGIAIVDNGGVAGGIVDAIDVSSSDITNAINVGDNTVLGTTAVIDFTDFDVSADGKITLAPDTNAMDINLTSANSTADVINLSAASLTTGTAIDIPDLDALTTGKALNIVSNSSSTSTRSLVQITNDNTAATSTALLSLQQDSTGFVIVATDGTNNTLEMRNLSTNFGAALNAGAFIDRNSRLSWEFFNEGADVTADTESFDSLGTLTENIAMTNRIGVYEGGTGNDCTFSIVDDALGGILRLSAGTADGGCLAMPDSATNNASLLLDADNLPVLLMKVKPSAADSTSGLYVGMSDATDGGTSAPANFIGFSNDNAGTLGTGWRAITRSASTSTTVDCSQTVSTSQYALLMVEVRSTTNVRFFIDPDISNGVSFSECGSGSSTNIPTAALAPQMIWQERSGGTAPSTLDVDFFRAWQDDAPAGVNPELAKTPVDIKEIEADLAKSSSLAQVYPADDVTIPAGTLVALAADGAKVAPTQATYDPNLLGVVVTDPAAQLSNGTIKGVSVATHGRAKVNVAADADIQAGDYLTSSDTPGVATKATRPGPVIGMALDTPKDGTVTVGISPQFWAGGILPTLTLNGEAIDLVTEGLNLESLLVDGRAFAEQDARLQALTARVSTLEGQVAGVTTTASPESAGHNTALAPNYALLASDGSLRLENNLEVIGELSVHADVTLYANLIVDSVHIASALNVHGPSLFFGEVTLSSDQAGLATIPRGGREVTVTYAQAFTNTPIVHATPQGQAPAYWVSRSDQTSFTITLATLADRDLTFTWTALSAAAPIPTLGNVVDENQNGIPDIDEITPPSLPSPEGRGEEIISPSSEGEPEGVNPSPTPTPTFSPTPTATPWPSPDGFTGPEPTSSLFSDILHSVENSPAPLPTSLLN